MTRTKKGSVAVENRKGMLCLRLPRSIFQGVQKRLSLGIPDNPENRKIAEAKAKMIEVDIAYERFDFSLNRYRLPSQCKPEPTLDLISLWESYTKFKEKSLASSTLKKEFTRVRNELNRLPTQRLSDARIIRNHLIERLTPDASRRVLLQIKACCNWAEDEGLIKSNPFVRFRLPQKVQTSREPFSRAERDLIIDAFSKNPFYNYYTPFVSFLFWTGCRTSEAIALRWSDIDPDLNSITFSEAVVDGIRKGTKTHRIRRFPTNQALKSLLQQIKPEGCLADQLVFPSPQGLTIDPHNFLNRAWRKVVGTLPIKYRPQYSTRHTFITLCLENGVQVTQIAAWVGNSPSVIWSNYAGLVNTVKVPEP